MNREELAEAILNAHNIAREHCRNTYCRNCKNFSAPMSYCMELVAADHLISLGLGMAEDLKLPENPYLPCDGDDRLLHGQVEGFEQAVACFESLNKKAWNPIDEPGGNQQSSRSTSENSSVNIPGEIKEPSRGK